MPEVHPASLAALKRFREIQKIRQQKNRDQVLIWVSQNTFKTIGGMARALKTSNSTIVQYLKYLKEQNLINPDNPLLHGKERYFWGNKKKPKDDKTNAILPDSLSKSGLSPSFDRHLNTTWGNQEKILPSVATNSPDTINNVQKPLGNAVLDPSSTPQHSNIKRVTGKDSPDASGLDQDTINYINSLKKRGII